MTVDRLISHMYFDRPIDIRVFDNNDYTWCYFTDLYELSKHFGYREVCGWNLKYLSTVLMDVEFFIQLEEEKGE